MAELGGAVVGGGGDIAVDVHRRSSDNTGRACSAFAAARSIAADFGGNGGGRLFVLVLVD